MFKFFDYFYYRAYNYYKKRGFTTPQISALCIVSLMQLFNLLTILFFIYLFLSRKFDVNKYLIGGFALLLLILNGIRYNTLNLNDLVPKWEVIDQTPKKINTIVLYISLSTILCISLAIYVGSRKF